MSPEAMLAVHAVLGCISIAGCALIVVLAEWIPPPG